MMFLFKENYPLEKIIISYIKKNNGDPEKAFHEIYNKYPFFLKSGLKQVIGVLIQKQANKEKLSGYWKKVDRKWILALNRLSPKINPKTGRPYDDMEIDLPPVPGDLGPGGKGLYTEPDKKSHFDTEDSEPQQMYERLRLKYKDLIQDPIELDQVLVQELIDQGFGQKITEIKFKSK